MIFLNGKILNSCAIRSWVSWNCNDLEWPYQVRAVQSDGLCWGSSAGVGCRQPGSGWGWVLPAHAVPLSLGGLSAPAASPHAVLCSALALCLAVQPGAYSLGERLRPWASWLSSCWIPSPAPVTTALLRPAPLSLPPDSPDSSFPTLMTSWPLTVSVPMALYPRGSIGTCLLFQVWLS